LDRKVRSLALTLLLLPAPAPAVPQAPAPEWPPVVFVSPRTEQRHPELGRVRDRLLAAIRARRLDAVRRLMAKTIRDQDDDAPVDEILASFGPLTRDTPLGDEWRALEQALAVGGVLRDGVYVLPFIEADAGRWRPRFERLFVAGQDVGVRAEPDAAADVVQRVSNALVQEAVGVPTRAGTAGSACADWTPVVGPERRLVWICTSDTRPVSGLYYAFTRARGAWLLTRIYSLPE
jgi:AcrR family transcriptional regulator